MLVVRRQELATALAILVLSSAQTAVKVLRVRPYA